MLSGFDVKEHGLYWNSWKPDRGYIRCRPCSTPPRRAAAYPPRSCGKHKLAHITHPGSVAVVSRPGYFCRKVVDEATRYFVEKKPEIEFIHFSDPDDLGHSDGWMSNPQLEAIRQTDRCLATLLDAVSAAGLDRETLFIISADHGGHGNNHSGKVDGRPIDSLDRVGARHPPGSPHQEPTSARSTPPRPRSGCSATRRRPGMIGKPVLEAFEPDPP